MKWPFSAHGFLEQGWGMGTFGHPDYRSAGNRRICQGSSKWSKDIKCLQWCATTAATIDKNLSRIIQCKVMFPKTRFKETPWPRWSIEMMRSITRFQVGNWSQDGQVIDPRSCGLCELRNLASSSLPGSSPPTGWPLPSKGSITRRNPL